MNQHSGFKTIQRPIVLKDIETFANDDTTPSIAGGNLFLTATGHSAARTITMLDGGLEGQVVTIQGANNTYKTTIARGTNMNLQADWLEEDDATITLMFDGTGWYEISRSLVNTLTIGLGTNSIASNTAFGYQALNGNNSGSGFNVAVGYQSLATNTEGNSNTAVGWGALKLNLSGSRNTAVGVCCLQTNSTGNYNTALGEFAGNIALGSSNVFLGYSAGKYETDSNSFYVDNQDRTNTAGDKAGALLYGTFNATPASQTLKVNGTLSVLSGIVPVTNDGMAIGTTALGFSDLFLASGGVINWDKGNVTLTQSSNALALKAGAQIKVDHLAETTSGHGTLFDTNVGILASPSAGQGLKVGAGWLSGSSISICSVISDVAVDENATNYAIAYYTPSFLADIASGKKDSGYRRGFDLRMMINDANFEGTLDSVTGLEVWAGIYGGTGTVTNSYGMRVARFCKTGTVTNSHGIYISAPTTGGTATNSWAFYSADTADSYFSGDVGIGSTAPLSALEVKSATVPTLTISNGESKEWTAEDPISNISFYCYDPSGIGAREVGAIKVVNATTGSSMAGELRFYASNYNTAATEIMKVNATTGAIIGNGYHVMVGGATLEAGSTNTIGIANGTAPNAHVDNQVILFSTDTGDATATLGIYAEQEVEAIGTFSASKKFKININGTLYWIQLDAV